MKKIKALKKICNSSNNKAKKIGRNNSINQGYFLLLLVQKYTKKIKLILIIEIVI